MTPVKTASEDAVTTNACAISGLKERPPSTLAPEMVPQKQNDDNDDAEQNMKLDSEQNSWIPGTSLLDKNAFKSMCMGPQDLDAVTAEVHATAQQGQTKELMPTIKTNAEEPASAPVVCMHQEEADGASMFVEPVKKRKQLEEDRSADECAVVKRPRFEQKLHPSSFSALNVPSNFNTPDPMEFLTGYLSILLIGGAFSVLLGQAV